MLNKISIVFIGLALSGCVNNSSVKRVIEDISMSNGCDTSPIYVSPTDGKRQLAAKIVVLNYRLNKCDNSDYTIEQKIKKYNSEL